MPEPERPVAVTAEELSDLLNRTEIRDVRLIRFHGELRLTPPDDVRIDFASDTPQFRKDPDRILAIFAHTLTYTLQEPDDEGQPVEVGTIETVHAVEVSLDGDDEPTDEAVSAMVQTNWYFMAYPYVRASLHRLPTEFGLPSVVLPYLKRGSELTTAENHAGEAAGPSIPADIE